MRVSWWLAIMSATIGCSVSPDSTVHGDSGIDAPMSGLDQTTACTSLMQTSCAALVRCRAYSPKVDGPITQATCDDMLVNSVDACVAQNAAKLGYATQADVTACTDALAAWSCTGLCVQAAVYPAACDDVFAQTSLGTVECVP